jgi:hypothetical protein
MVGDSRVSGFEGFDEGFEARRVKKILLRYLAY